MARCHCIAEFGQQTARGVGGQRGEHHALPWTAMHADFWNTWRQSALEEYVNGCLRRGRTVRGNPCT